MTRHLGVPAMVMCAVAFSAACSPTTEESVCTDPLQVNDWYDVYNVVLAQGHGLDEAGRRVLVREHTSGAATVRLHERPRGFEKAAIVDGEERAQALYQLSADGLTVGDPFELVPTVRAPDDSASEEEWQRFAMVHGGVRSTYWLSPPGIGCEQVVVGTLRMCGPSCAQWSSFALEPSDEGWEVTVSDPGPLT